MNGRRLAYLLAMDLAELFSRSVDGFTVRVKQIGPDQWTNGTPCTEWDVRALVNHVVGEQVWMAPLFHGATVAEVGDRFDGDLLGDDPVATAVRAADEARATVDQPGALGRTVHLSFGDTPAEEYVRQLLADHLVHAWDLSVAIGVDRLLDPGAVHAGAEWFADREDAYRAGGATGPRLVADDPAASEQDRLIAAFGRDPGA
jgi:uncharacterized protein (TIGR03086 family)